jgi:DNA invertase Pin-like site-specific DNA recombinase
MTVAIYIRLSLEDGDLSSSDKLESESITNQRSMLVDYICTSPELCGAEIMEFCDDGYSGKNFDRPGMKRLIEAARNGGIQCIVVKDLSRFGRDYITVGNYISRVFPFLGVRFISVNDRFDSQRKGDLDSLDTSFRTLIYDLYSRDLSRKVRSAKKNLAERGVYINPVAPYGYVKDPNDKHHLMIAPVAADVVKRIFCMVAEGNSTAKVAQVLNAEHAPTPSANKAGTSSAHANWSGENFWSRKMVSWIIRDRQYIGSFVYGKRVRDQIGVHRQVKVNLDDWIVVDNRHEPIISKELFQKAQEQLGGEFRQTNGHVKQDYPLHRKVYCGVCGMAIVRRAKKAPYYRCDTRNSLPDAECCREKIYEQEILDAVTEAIRMQAHCAVEAEHILEARRKQDESRIRLIQEELRSFQMQQNQLNEQTQKLYEAFIDGKLNREMYITKKAALQQRLKEIFEKTESIKRRIFAAKSEHNRFIESYGKYTQLDELTSEIAIDLLERVTIWPDGRLDISLNYLDEYSNT